MTEEMFDTLNEYEKAKYFRDSLIATKRYMEEHKDEIKTTRKQFYIDSAIAEQNNQMKRIKLAEQLMKSEELTEVDI